MKLQAELNKVVEKFKSDSERIHEYAEYLKKNGDYQDFETRLAWDVLRGNFGTKYICELYDKYNCTDKHITTLAKKALAHVYKV